MDQQLLESRLRLVAQGAAVCTVAIYFVGFLTVSLYHSQFGIIQSDLLRGRILSAGILFSVFLAFPLFELAALYGLWGLRVPIQNSGNKAHDTFITPLLRTLFFVLSSLGAAFFIRLFLLVDVPPFRVYLSVLFAGGVLAGVAAFVSVHRNKHVAWSVALILGGLVLVSVCVWWIPDRGYQYLVVWFCLCAFMAQTIRSLRDPDRLGRLQLHTLVVNGIVVVGFFGVFIYPHISPALGGGQIIPATLHFGQTEVPLGNTSQAKVWLIDETDLGFYVVQSKDSKKAVFVPRNAVNAIFFGD